MKPNKPILPTTQDVEDWEKIGESLKWMKARLVELLPFVANQAPSRDLDYHLRNAIATWEASGGIQLPDATATDVAPEVETPDEEPCHKRGPKTDSFLCSDVDRDDFVVKLRGMIRSRFKTEGKHGMMEVRRENLHELEPSKYFACLFAVLIEYGVAKENATPKGFERLIKEAIAGTVMEDTFSLHYTSYNNVINDWMKMCKSDVLKALKGRQRVLISSMQMADCNGKEAINELQDWKNKYSYVADNAREDGLLRNISNT
jgi:hypothetical protein